MIHNWRLNFYLEYFKNPFKMALFVYYLAIAVALFSLMTVTLT